MPETIVINVSGHIFPQVIAFLPRWQNAWEPFWDSHLRLLTMRGICLEITHIWNHSHWISFEGGRHAREPIWRPPARHTAQVLEVVVFSYLFSDKYNQLLLHRSIYLLSSHIDPHVCPHAPYSSTQDPLLHIAHTHKDSYKKTIDHPTLGPSTHPSTQCR